MRAVSARDWGHGFWWWWVKLGVPSGFVFGLLQYATASATIGRAIGAAAFFGVVFGFTMALVIRWRTRGLFRLDRSDQVEVVRAVEDGREVTDPALAAAVLEYVATIRRSERSQETDRALMIFLLGAGVLLAAGNAFSGDARAAVCFAVVSLWFGAIAVRVPARRQRLLSNAAVAETAAQRLIDAQGSDALGNERS